MSTLRNARLKHEAGIPGLPRALHATQDLVQQSISHAEGLPQLNMLAVDHVIGGQQSLRPPSNLFIQRQ